MDLLFGTTNPGKLRELRRLVAGLPVRVVSPEDLGRSLPEVAEDGATFQANAEKKAIAWARWSGLYTLADDSGLCVDALGGAPGVYSARWADLEPGPSPASAAARDERNNDKLLRELAGVEEDRRGAEYRAVLSLARPDGVLVASVSGVCRGRIGHERRGAGGFGYDPLFIPDAELAGTASARSMAELPAEVKDALSHRGDAFRRLLPVLAGLAAARNP
jgi:XTP/dITP diphosphohydrolase